MTFIPNIELESLLSDLEALLSTCVDNAKEGKEGLSEELCLRTRMIMWHVLMATHLGHSDDRMMKRIEGLFERAIRAAEGTIYERNIAARAKDLSELKRIEPWQEWLRNT
jgi:hypothetical protein